jgi:hypothetical protein
MIAAAAADYDTAMRGGVNETAVPKLFVELADCRGGSDG